MIREIVSGRKTPWKCELNRLERQMAKPTAKQRAALEAIGRLNAGAAMPPSVRELQRELGVKSTESAHSMIVRLEGMGLVSRVENASRSLRLTEEGERIVGSLDPSDMVPFYGRDGDGRVSASAGRVAVAKELVSRYGKLMAYTVLAGEAPAGALICDGDTVLVSAGATGAYRVYMTPERRLRVDETGQSVGGSVLIGGAVGLMRSF